MSCYRGSPGLAVVVGFLGVATIAIALMAVVTPGTWSRELEAAGPQVMFALAFALLIIVGTGLLLMVIARQLTVSFLVDERSITRRVLWSEATIDWDELARFTETLTAEGGARGRYVLFARDGRRMAVPFAGLRDGDALRERIEKHLGPLREQRRQEIADLGWRVQTYRTIGLAALGLFLPAFVLVGLLGLLALRHPHGLSPGEIGVVVTALGGAPLVLFLGIAMLSSTLTLADGVLSKRSLISRQEIALDRVDSIGIRPAQDEAPRGEIAMIRGDGRTICISSATHGYHEILAVISDSAGVEPDRGGHAAKRRGKATPA